MEPKTNLQKRVVHLSKTLRPITTEVEAWAYNHCFPKLAYRTKHQINCLECGHQWKDDFVIGSKLIGNTCPSCGAKLKVKSTKARKYYEKDYFQIFQVFEGMQLIRTVHVSKTCRVGKKADFSMREVTQHWINEKGKCAFLAIRTYSVMGYFGGARWDFGSVMEVRGNNTSRFDLKVNITAPGRQILPVIRRNGFTGTFRGFVPQYLFIDLLSNPKAETLWKAGQISLYSKIGYYDDPVKKYWPSIKICLRNNYIVKDAGIWNDYLDNLVEFGKDILSPNYVCPSSLNAAHDKYVRLKRDARLREEIIALQTWLAPRVPGMMIHNLKKLPAGKLSQLLERLQAKRKEVEKRENWETFKKQISKIQEKYEKEKGRFLGLSFGDGDITIKTLDTIEEFRIEGEAMGHCVFENKYYDLKNSLILSAQVKGVRTETIEVYLNPLKVSQVRGKNNQNSKYHDKILQLLEANLHQIKKRMRVHTKKSIENLETVAA